jgi:predicted RNA-binding protein
MKRNYWLDLFTGTTWDEFIKAGANISGFRESRWSTVQKIKTGDYLICYLTGVSRFIGILEVIDKPFKDNSNIWKDEDFPSRLKVKLLVSLNPNTAIPVHILRDQLSFFQDLKSPHAWTGAFRSSPAKWSYEDGEAVMNALMNAKENPIERPVDPKKLSYRPKGFKSKIGTVSMPSPDIEEKELVDKKSYSDHIEIQYLLLKLGSDMGFDIWAARNDRGREFKGKKIANIPRIRTELPNQFDDITNRTIEMIDVLWLQKNNFIAAFEIESTTSIYSGLLRMSDLIAMQPNVNIPLYLVAPDERREKVISEINRATFSRLSPRLSEICRYISFSDLKEKVKQIESIVQYVKPEILEDLSESCDLEE